MITHHLEELTPSTRHVIIMKQGCVLAEGAPTDVLTPENLSAAFGCKVFVRRASGRFYAEVLPEAWLDFA
jgi:iron complex transport system ATP-binding protein